MTANNAFKFMLRKNQSRFIKNKISRQMYDRTTEIIVWWYKSIIEILDYSKSFFNDLDFYKNIAATAVFVK